MKKGRCRIVNDPGNLADSNDTFVFELSWSKFKKKGREWTIMDK